MFDPTGGGSKAFQVVIEGEGDLGRNAGREEKNDGKQEGSSTELIHTHD